MTKPLPRATGTSRPASAEELLTQARAHFDSLSRQLRLIARYIEAHREVLGLAGVQDLAAKCGVQPSAVVRFAKHFGLSGFSEMQALFRDEAAQKLATPPDYRTRIRTLVQKGKKPLAAEQIRQEVVQASIAGLQTLAQPQLDTGEFQAAVELMAGAPALWLVANRRSFPVGAYLSYSLQQTAKPIHWLNGLGHMQLGETRAMTSRDVMVAISFEPYAKETLEVVETALAKNVRVIAITDSKFSPIARSASCTLIAQDAAPYGFRTLTSTMCLAQALFISLAYTMELQPRVPARG